MKVFGLWFIALGLMICSVEQTQASLIDVDASGAGWISSTSGGNGNSASNNYLAGSYPDGANLYRNHFDFVIPVLDGTLVSAVLELVNPSHAGGTNTYTVSSLGAFGSYGFSDIGTGTTYGSVDISGTGTVSFNLNAAALAAITAAQGGTFSLGGVNSGESAFPGTAFDFGFSGGVGDVTLSLTTSAVPEPASLTLLGMGAFGLVAGAYRRRRSQKIAV